MAAVNTLKPIRTKKIRHKKKSRNNASHTKCRCQVVEGTIIGPEEETTLDLNFEGSQYLDKRWCEAEFTAH